MKSYVYMILTAICLSTIGVLVKLIGDNMHFMSMNFFRVFIGFLFLLMVVPFLDKNTFKITKKDAKEYFVVGLVFTIAICLFTTANLFTAIQNAVLINHIYPFFVLIFAYFMLREKVTKTKIVTLIIAIIGLAIINPLQAEGMLGNMLSFIGAIFYGLLIVLMRKEDIDHAIGDVLWFLFFATLLLLPFPFIFGIGNIMAVWHYLLLLGIVSTGLAYLFYNLALEKIEAEIAAIISIIVSPLFAIFLAVVVINEDLNYRIITGGLVLIIAGIYLQTHRKQLRES